MRSVLLTKFNTLTHIVEEGIGGSGWLYLCANFGR